MKTSPVKEWRRQKNLATLIGQTGKIMHWTIIRIPPQSFTKEAPYPVVIVKMDSGEKMIAQLVDYQQSDLVKDKKVVAVLRRMYPENTESIIGYAIKCKPYEDD